ncbi:MAG: class I SAM-dependent methyltransferase [Actinobacteria bacterium]|nr:class I SAM-dependent methyltransferase [Actinomycetota bacterium]MBU4386655.1 class I SAM-dependent methyltransferase [Actinomycetota bacterium]
MRDYNWHEDNRIWETIGPAIFGETTLKNASMEVKGIVSLTGITTGTRILDLCCGVGRHSVELARLGFLVTAVDRTAAYLEEARRRADKEGLEIEFVRDDMRYFCRPGAFDAVLNIYTSFGYFRDPDEDRKVLNNIHRSLKPGGVLFIDMMGKEVLARIFKEKHREERDGVVIIQEGKLDQNWGWINSRWTVLEDDRKMEVEVSHRLYSAVELSALLEESGLKLSGAYGDFEGAPYDHKAERLILVARK